MTAPNIQTLQNPPQDQHNSNQQNQDPNLSNQSQSQTQQLNTQNQGGGQSNPQDVNTQIFNFLNEVRGEMQQLRNQNQMLQFQLQQSNRGGMPVNNAPQPPALNIPDKDAFWEQPGEATKTVVEQLMERSLAPIQRGLQYFMGQQQYQNAKNQMKQMQQFSALSLFEDIFDNIVNQALSNGIPLSDGLLLTSYHTAFGLAANSGRFNQNVQQQQQQPNSGFQQQQPTNFPPMVLGLNGQPQNQQQQPNNPNNQQQRQLLTPPYLATNNNNNNNSSVNVQLRNLDENEETVRKFNRMSKAEFLFYGNEISEDVFKAADPQGYAKHKRIPLSEVK